MPSRQMVCGACWDKYGASGNSNFAYTSNKTTPTPISYWAQAASSEYKDKAPVCECKTSRNFFLTLVVKCSSTSKSTHVSVWIAEGGGSTPNCFLNPPNTLWNYAQGGQLCTINIWFTSQFWLGAESQKFNPQLIFHNSDTDTCQSFIHNISGRLGQITSIQTYASQEDNFLADKNLWTW